MMSVKTKSKSEPDNLAVMFRVQPRSMRSRPHVPLAMTVTIPLPMNHAALPSRDLSPGVLVMTNLSLGCLVADLLPTTHCQEHAHSTTGNADS